jgi:hypothetical protein
LREPLFGNSFTFSTSGDNHVLQAIDDLLDPFYQCIDGFGGHPYLFKYLPKTNDSRVAFAGTSLSSQFLHPPECRMVLSNNNHQSRHFRQEPLVQLQNLPYLIKIAVALFGISIALTRRTEALRYENQEGTFISFDEPIGRVAIAGTGVIERIESRH